MPLKISSGAFRTATQYSPNFRQCFDDLQTTEEHHHPGNLGFLPVFDRIQIIRREEERRRKKVDHPRVASANISILESVFVDVCGRQKVVDVRADEVLERCQDIIVGKMDQAVSTNPDICLWEFIRNDIPNDEADTFFLILHIVEVNQAGDNIAAQIVYVA